MKGEIRPAMPSVETAWKDITEEEIILVMQDETSHLMPCRQIGSHWMTTRVPVAVWKIWEGQKEEMKRLGFRASKDAGQWQLEFFPPTRLDVREDGTAEFHFPGRKVILGKIVVSTDRQELIPDPAFWTTWRQNQFSLRVAGFHCEKDGGVWRVFLRGKPLVFKDSKIPAHVLRRHAKSRTTLEYQDEGVGQNRVRVFYVRRNGELLFRTERIEDAIRDYEKSTEGY